MKSSSTPSDFRLATLEYLLEPDEYLYILRNLYKIVLYSERHKESLSQLCYRIWQFEKSCKLSGWFTKLPIQSFLRELELAQYFHPISQREISFSYFIHQDQEK